MAYLHRLLPTLSWDAESPNCPLPPTYARGSFGPSVARFPRQVASCFRLYLAVCPPSRPQPQQDNKRKVHEAAQAVLDEDDAETQEAQARGGTETYKLLATQEPVGEELPDPDGARGVCSH